MAVCFIMEIRDMNMQSKGFIAIKDDNSIVLVNDYSKAYVFTSYMKIHKIGNLVNEKYPDTQHCMVNLEINSKILDRINSTESLLKIMKFANLNSRGHTFINVKLDVA